MFEYEDRLINRRLISICALVCAVLLGACQPQNNTSEEAVYSDLAYQLVAQKDLSKYWVQINPEFQIAPSNLVSPVQSGRVEVGFAINQQGKPERVEVLRSSPDNAWDKHALQAAQAMRFKATDNQPQLKQQVYTTWTFYFSPQ